MPRCISKSMHQKLEKARLARWANKKSGSIGMKKEEPVEQHCTVDEHAAESESNSPITNNSALHSAESPTAQNIHNQKGNSCSINNRKRLSEQILPVGDKISKEPRNQNTGVSEISANTANNTFFCLLCSKETTFSLNTSNNCADIGSSDFLAMFILNKMLNVPIENLVDFLSTLGSPSGWISICHNCAPVVNEAFEAQRKISELEMKLRKLQREMKDKIKKTFVENQLKKQPSIDDKSTTTMFLVHPVFVAMSTRRYVASGLRLRWRLKYINNSATVQSDSILPEKEADDDSQTSQSDSGPGDDDGYNDNTNNMIQDNAVTSEEPYAKASSESVLGQKSLFCQRKKVKYTEPLAALPVYGCASCPNLKPMLLQSFVKHLDFHNDRPYKCMECNSFRTGSVLELQAHVEGNQINNHVCSLASLVKVKLKTERIWECGYCSSTFELQTQRDFHETSVHTEEKPIPLRFDCSRCSNKIRDYHEWRIHRSLDHPDLSKLGCIFCDKMFKLETIENADVEDFPGRSKHIKEEHGIDFLRQLWECTTCGMNFVNLNGLKGHMEKEHGFNRNDSPLSCPICFKTAKTRVNVEAHIRRAHLKKRKSTVERLMCDVCPYHTVTGLSSLLLEHKLLKHGIEPTDGRKIFKCSKDNCSFKSLSKNKLEKHMIKEHDAERKFKCKVCGKGFLTAANERDHMLTHSKIKPFQCELCGNTFAVKNYLYIHKRLSHKNRPFASTHKKKLHKKRKPSTSLPEGNNVFDQPSPSNHKSSDKI